LYRKYGRLTSAASRLLGARNLARLARALAYPARRQVRVPSCHDHAMGRV